jgi:starch phosphorylase
MKPILQFRVLPNIPEEIKPLERLAYNLRFSWNPEVCKLFIRLDSRLWEQSGHNPVYMLHRIDQKILREVAEDEGFVAHMERLVRDMDEYLQEGKCPILRCAVEPEKFLVAYFSMEFGLTECLPIYSGGLGVLAGDHLKSASDLNLPMIGVGLMYQEGYFRQYLNFEGWQQEYFPKNDFDLLPARMVNDGNGRPIYITVDFKGAEVKARIWQVQVGRIPLYLLDTNVEENPPEFRETTAKLYGGDREMRLRQEILLGMGGVRALKALGLNPTVYHMNEGHCAFVPVERIRMLMEEEHMTFDEARELTVSSCVFTTHTPVPAGNDYFQADLMREYFADYSRRIGISPKVLFAYGRKNPWDDNELFCMTVLALRLSSFDNAVSQLHSRVSRDMWREVWSNFPVEDVPIVGITNGIHIPSWISGEMADLYDRYLGPRWVQDPDHAKVWEGVLRIPDSEIWRARERLRERMVSFARERWSLQLEKKGASRGEIEAAREVLNPEYLTIVHSRRFATYKRATLILRDKKRFADIVSNPERPVQFIFAGKAHPQDREGKAFIKEIFQTTMEAPFKQRMVFIEDYDMMVSDVLVQGADVWLNTPRRPLEACGTSGMKASANGGLNMSILDGWWAEAYQLDNGWGIGAGEEYDNPNYQDDLESRNIYDLLEKEVVPLFYNRDKEGIPRGWIARMKTSMHNLCPVFNSHRMLEEYTQKCYEPCDQSFKGLSREGFAGAKDLARWRRHIQVNWNQVKIEQVISVAPSVLISGMPITIDAHVRLGELTPRDVVCELYYGFLDPAGDFVERETMIMQTVEARDSEGCYHYQATLDNTDAGNLGITVRVVPYHPLMGNRYSLGLVAWGSR